MVVDRLMKLFAGMDEAYGTYDINKSKGLKQVGQAKTIRLDPAADKSVKWKELWDNHVNGASSLGVIPINIQERCWWGCIDVDNYNGLDHKELANRFIDMKLPLMHCRSKSGGAHIFMFMREAVPAELLIEKLKELAAALGFAKAELFPKQSKVLTERGDLGNWLNMPYFNASRTTRYGIDFNGEPMPLEDFLTKAEAMRITEAELAALTVETTKELETFKDAPPCLQYLLTQGFPEGTRNNAIYDLAVYARKAYPENEWRQKLEEFNYKYCNPPLPAGEIYNIQKSMDGKEYRYKCAEAPIAAFCNPAICKTRKHGINASSSMPTLSSLSKLCTDPPLWFLNVDSNRIELTTAEFHDQKKFQIKCMEQINIMPPLQKQADWQMIVQDLLDNVTPIEAPKDSGIEGTFFDMLEQFCTSRNSALSRDELLRGKPWTEVDEKDGIRKTYFRLGDLMEFLQRKKFTSYTRPQITVRIQKFGGNHHFFKIKGKGTNVWWVPAFEMQTEPFDIPKFNSDTPF